MFKSPHRIPFEDRKMRFFLNFFLETITPSKMQTAVVDLRVEILK